MGILSGIGNGLDDIWQYLINDPTKPSGGILQQALNPQAAVAASTQTPLGAPSQAVGGASPNAAPPGGLNLSSFFKPHSGILGNSPLAAALSGGLAGLGSSTGYTGLAAVGQGFGGATQAAQQRHEAQMQAALAGQQYQQSQNQLAYQPAMLKQQLASGQQGLAQGQLGIQSGQQGLAQGNLQLAQSLRNYNLMNQVYHPGSPDLTYADLQDPQKLADVMAMGSPNAAGGSPATGQPAGSGPRQDLAQGIPAITQALAAREGTAQDKLSGAIGGLTPGTFKQYAQPGESFDNPRDRQTVNQRVIADLSLRFGGDPARIAVGYFSGPGNVAPAGSPTPWIADTKDAHGTSVSGYVNDIQRNLGMSGTQGTADAGSQGQPDTSGQPDQLTQEFQQSHYGQTPAQWRQLGVATGNKGMVEDADKWDTNLITGTELAKTKGQISMGRAGSQPINLATGAPIGKGVPSPVKIYDQKSGNYVSGYRYPSGELVIGNEADGQPATEALGPGNEKLQEGYATRRTEMGDAINSGIAGEQQALAMATALKATQSGTWATEFGHIKAGLQSAGLGDLADTLLPNTDAAAVQMATKDALQGVFSQMKPLLGPRIAAQEVNLYAKASANPDLLPAANAKMISMMVGGLRYKRDLYHALSSQPGNTDPNDFEIQFQKDHPLQGYINDAEKEIGPLKGMEKAAKAPDPNVNPITGTKWAKYDTYPDQNGVMWSYTGLGDPAAKNADGTPKYWKRQSEMPKTYNGNNSGGPDLDAHSSDTGSFDAQLVSPKSGQVSP